MKLFSFFKKAPKPKEVQKASNHKAAIHEQKPKVKEQEKPKKVFHNFPEPVKMQDFSIAGVYRIDLLLIMARTTGENNPFDSYELLYDVLLDDGVINVPLVLYKEARKYGIFAFYSEKEASNFKKFRYELTENADFEDCYYVSHYNPEKYEIEDGSVEIGTSFNALFKLEKEASDESYEGHYAMWWSTPEDPHFGVSKCREYYKTIYENMADYESIFTGMLSNSLNNKDEISRINLPEEEILIYVTGPENKKILLALSKEKGMRFLLNRKETSSIYRERLLRIIAKSIKFLNAGLEERQIPKDPETSPKPMEYFNFVSDQIQNAKVVAETIGGLTIGNPEPLSGPYDDKIRDERIVIRMKVGEEKNLDPSSSPVDIPEGKKPVLFPYHEDLLIGIAQDYGHSYGFLNKEDFERYGKSKEELVTLGLNNIIKEIGDKIKIQGNPEESYILIACGGNHEMALLAFDSFWEQIESVFKSDFCVCFPVRDILLASNFYNAVGMDGLRDRIQEFYYDPKQVHKMSNGIYLRKEGKWKLVERVEAAE